MSLDLNDEELLESLDNWTKCFVFCVYRKQYYWVFCWERYCNLIEKKNLDAMLKKNLCVGGEKLYGNDEYESDLRTFRGGIHSLTEENFLDFLKLPDVKIFQTDEIRTFFFASQWGNFEALNNYVERFLSFNIEVDTKFSTMITRLISMLPKFYINFDRHIFLHMYTDRFHESVAPEGWHARMGDFEHMIPASHRYWVRNKYEDIWTITNL